MNINDMADDLWGALISGVLKSFCSGGFPSAPVIQVNFWDQYRTRHSITDLDGMLIYEVLDELVRRGWIRVSGSWFDFN
ncbi:hypothetical protein QSH14_18270 [Proteus faecis]|uniref:Phage protein n=2 Tax=Enterobacterales TaxID=91347 RepID=A0AAW7CR61_9GAMM|nr:MULTISPECIES: hypothetical protein [Enterobacterales]MDL5169014.1 hypothetical protein [Proteus faecis]MDL5191395.1 hypothetical protein [Escherichia coli]MDL5277001.1 hypothetical protein [Proteus faecis]MDL5280566.1 hypothetical protein [Proteus faecis]MDL5291041.1 hypothetical protein [Klebsiella pneumoniae]